MPQQDILNVLLQVRNLRGFVAGMGEASGAVKKLGASAVEANAAAAESNKAWSGVAGLATKGLKATAFAAAAASYEAIKMGVSFDNTLTMIQTTTGASAKQVDMVREHILHMNDAAFSPQLLAESAKFAEAITHNTVKSLKILDAANTGAALSGANVVETAKTLAAIMRVQLPGALGTAQQVMAEVNATVGTGAMTLDEFNHAMGQGVLPIAKTYGLTFQDVAAALAVFTDEHIRGSSAMAQLATGMHFLIGGSTKAQKALTMLGIGGDKLGLMLRGPHGLLVASTAINEALTRKFGSTPEGLVKAARTLDSIFPAGRGRILRVLLNQMTVYNQKLNQQSQITGEYARSVEKYHETASYKIRNAWSLVQQDLINLYDNIKGPGVAALLTLIGAVRVLIQGLGAITHDSKLLLAILVPLAAAWVAYKVAVVGAVIADKSLELQALIQSFMRLTTELGFSTAAMSLFDAAADANPVGLIALGIAAVVAAIVILIMNWHKVADAAVTAWHWIEGAIVTVWDWIKGHWPLLLLVLTGPFGLAILFIKNHFDSILHFIEHLPNKIAKVAVGMWDGIKDAFRSALNWIIGAWDSLHFKIGGWHVGPVTVPHITIGMPHIPYLAEGGTVTMGGLAMVGERGPELVELPSGARVNRNSPTFGSSGSNSQLDLSGHIDRLAKALSRRPFANNIYMDGKLFYRTMSQYAADGMARG